ncbi:MAG TPA: prepilin-type N-terminal cleavage/methylation domain-containing protein [Phycisphaerales bacterium]|nr:prepilin-type N-terminal cleavage/methylation domain-containing protein [Phycisphaerales bacterium]
MNLRDANFHRRSFTLIELIVAGVIAALVLGAVTTALANLGRAKSICKTHYEAYRRADAALSLLRKNIASVLRSDDLFYTKLEIEDQSFHKDGQEFSNDGILLFNTVLRSSQNSLDFSGEGSQYETQYRVEDDGTGPVLWQRRDMQPDEYLRAGGLATPIVEGILALSFEAYDGDAWYSTWDSDSDGLPTAIRITVMACGNTSEDDLMTAPRATLQTVVAIDRVVSPKDLFVEPDDETSTGNDAQNPDDANNSQNNGDENTGGQNGGGTPTTGGGGGPGRGPGGNGNGPGNGPGGGRPGGGGGQGG